MNRTVVYEIVGKDITTFIAGHNNSTLPPGPQTPAPHQVYDSQVKEVFAYMTYCLVPPGILGNLLAIGVLSHKTMRSSTNVYLSALAVWDCIVILTAFILMGIFTMYPQVYPCITIVYPLAVTAQTATIWITVSFTVERFIAVKYPLKAASMCTIKRARTVIYSVSLCSISYNLPRWFDYYPFTMDIWLMQNKVYREVYFIALYLPVMLLIPVSALSIINVFLIRAVRESRRQRHDMNVRQTRENNVTLMLVSVVIVFIICQFPALVYNMVYAIDAQLASTNRGYIFLSSTRNFLVVLNSTVNFLLYCAFGQKFRKTFCELFFKCCLKDSQDRQHSFSYMSGNQAATPKNTKVMQNKRYFQIPTGAIKTQPIGVTNPVVNSPATKTSSSTTTTKTSDECALNMENRHALVVTDSPQPRTTSHTSLNKASPIEEIEMEHFDQDTDTDDMQETVFRHLITDTDTLQIYKVNFNDKLGNGALS